MDIYCIQNVPGEYWYVRAAFFSTGNPDLKRCKKPEYAPPDWKEFHLREGKRSGKTVWYVDHRPKGSTRVTYEVDRLDFSMPFFFVSDFKHADDLVACLKKSFQAGKRAGYQMAENATKHALDLSRPS